MPISIIRSLRPVGRPPGGVLHKRQGTSLLSNWVFTSSSLLYRVARWLSFTTTTAVAYLRKEGGTRSPLLTTLAQEILRWTESLSIRLAPQFLPGSNNVLADALSHPHQLPHSKWSLILTVFQSLRRLWPVQIDLFATSDNHRCSIYISPYRDPMSAGTDAFLQSWDGLPAYAFTPMAIILRFLAKLRSSTGPELPLVAPHWAQRPWFSDLLQLSLAPPVILPARQDLLHCLGLVIFTRISVGSGFMPGDSPAIY